MRTNKKRKKDEEKYQMRRFALSLRRMKGFKREQKEREMNDQLKDKNESVSALSGLIIIYRNRTTVLYE
jgi:hypothetical protein